MKKSLIILFLIALIPFTEISAKRVRYFFNKIESYDLRKGTKNIVWGSYILELNTDYQTVVLKLKNNGATQWKTIKADIMDTDMGSGPDGIDGQCYTMTNGDELYINYNTVKKYSTVYLENRNTKLYFGRPTRVEKF